MSIRYVCRSCGKKLGLSGFEAVNEVGSKCCDRCRSNGYLETVSEESFRRAMRQTETDLPLNVDNKGCRDRLMERSVYDAGRDASTVLRPSQDGKGILDEAFEENE